VKECDSSYLSPVTSSEGLWRRSSADDNDGDAQPDDGEGDDKEEGGDFRRRREGTP